MISKIFCFGDSLPKAPSISCPNSSCKSNPTHLTQNLTKLWLSRHNTASESQITWKATEGETYKMDLADTVYCSCTAITVKPKIHADKPLTRLILNPCGNLTLGTRDHLEHPMAEVILCPALNVSPYCTCFDLEKETNLFNHTKQFFAIIKYSYLYRISLQEPLFLQNPSPEKIQSLQSGTTIIS